MTKLQIPIESVLPDPSDYKRHSPKYAPQNLAVEVEVPDEECRIDETGMEVLTELGMELVLAKLVEISHRADKRFINKIQTGK